MNGFDLIYCTNEKCTRCDCRRHRTKIPEDAGVRTLFMWSKFKEKNCKYYISGVKEED